MPSAIGISEPVAEYASTANNTSYSMGAFTPRAYSLLVVLVFADGTAAAAPTMTGGSLTWTRRQRIVYNTTDIACIFTAPVGASPASTNPTFDCTGDAATGIVMMAFEVIGYDQASPIAQSDSEARTAANPVITLPGSMGTNNAYIAGHGGPRNPPTSTEPASWIETADTGHNSPAAGASSAYRVNGETGTTITFTSASYAYGIVAIELNVGSISGAGNIASAEAFGSPYAELQIASPTSIASAEAFENPSTNPQVAAPTSISSAEAFESPYAELEIASPTSIASAEAFGNPTITTGDSISDAGNIATAETFGSPYAELQIASPTSIASAEAFGNPSTNAQVADPTSISSTETFGSPYAELQIASPTSIASAEAFGNPSVTTGDNITDVGDIHTGEAFGVPTVTGPVAILVPGGAGEGGGGLWDYEVADGRPEVIRVSKRDRRHQLQDELIILSRKAR